MGFSSGTTRSGAPLTTVAQPLPASPGAPVEPPRCTTTAALLDAFAAAFGRGDVSGIADCYTTPAIVVTDERSVVFGSRDEVIDGFAAVVTRYWASGVVPAGYTLEHETVLTANLREIAVEWRHCDAAGRIRFRDHNRYLLRRENDGTLRIHIAVVVDGTGRPPARSVESGS